MRNLEVKAKSLDDFLDKYYKHDRYKGRNGNVWGENYSELVKQSSREDIDRLGYCIISKHDSKTGEIVAYYPKLKALKNASRW